MAVVFWGQSYTKEQNILCLKRKYEYIIIDYITSQKTIW